MSLSHMSVLFFFFFQAEDGIRDVAVTGVQTCALPISPSLSVLAGSDLALRRAPVGVTQLSFGDLSVVVAGQALEDEAARQLVGRQPAAQPFFQFRLGQCA